MERLSSALLLLASNVEMSRSDLDDDEIYDPTRRVHAEEHCGGHLLARLSETLFRLGLRDARRRASSARECGSDCTSTAASLTFTMAVPRSRIVDLMKVCLRPPYPSAHGQVLTQDRSNAASSAPSSTQPESVSVTRSCVSACVVLRSLHTTLVAWLHSRTCKSYTLASRPTTNSRRTVWSTCRSQRAEERAHQRRRGRQQVRARGNFTYKSRDI